MGLAKRRIERHEETCDVEGEELGTRDGAFARVETKGGVETLTVHDRGGRLLFEYDAATGRGSLIMPEGDLRLAAPNGVVEIVGGAGVRIATQAKLDVSATASALDLGVASARATSLHGAVERAEFTFGTVLRKAERVIEEADTMYKRVTDLLETKAGRVRTLVRDGLWMKGDAVTVLAKKDVQIDGEHINLG